MITDASHSYLLDGLHGRRRVLVAAQVDHDPSDVAEEGDGYGGADEGQERLNHSQTDDVISALRTITCNSTAIIHTASGHNQLNRSTHQSLHMVFASDKPLDIHCAP